jgi:hypothetical protein
MKCNDVRSCSRRAAQDRAWRFTIVMLTSKYFIETAMILALGALFTLASCASWDGAENTSTHTASFRCIESGVDEVKTPKFFRPESKTPAFSTDGGSFLIEYCVK